MNLRVIAILGICAIVAIALGLWLGDEYHDELRALLRTLARVL